MASTVKVPLFGQVNKGTAVGVGAASLALAAYFIIKKEKTAKQQAAAAAAATQQATQNAAAQSGYGYGTGSYGYGSGYYGYGEYQPSYGYGASGGFNATGYYGYGTPEPTGVANTTNAQWTQAAITQLTGEGYTAQTVSAALGAYISGAPVTSDQQSIIQAAIAVEGYPPQPGANGYPPSIQVQGTTGGGTGGGQGGSGGTTPAVPPSQPSTPSGPQQINVVGQTLEYGLPDLEGAGWTINSVRTPTGLYAQGGYPASQKTATITATGFNAGSGVAGVHFANSVDVTAN